MSRRYPAPPPTAMSRRELLVFQKLQSIKERAMVQVRPSLALLIVVRVAQEQRRLVGLPEVSTEAIMRHNPNCTDCYEFALQKEAFAFVDSAHGRGMTAFAFEISHGQGKKRFLATTYGSISYQHRDHCCSLSIRMCALSYACRAPCAQDR